MRDGIVGLAMIMMIVVALGLVIVTLVAQAQLENGSNRPKEPIEVKSCMIDDFGS